MGHYGDYYDAMNKKRDDTDAEAQRIYLRLSEFPSGNFTVEELAFLLKINWSDFKSHWNDNDLYRLQDIARKFLV